MPDFRYSSFPGFQRLGDATTRTLLPDLFALCRRAARDLERLHDLGIRVEHDGKRYENPDGCLRATSAGYLSGHMQ